MPKANAFISLVIQFVQKYGQNEEISFFVVCQ